MPPWLRKPSNVVAATINPNKITSIPIKSHHYSITPPPPPMAPEKTIKFHDIPVKINKMDLPPERKSQSWRRTAKPWVPRCRRPWSVIKELGGSNYRCKMILGKSTLWNQYFNTTCNGHMIHMVWIWSDRAYEHCYDRYNIYIYTHIIGILYIIYTHT